MRCALRALVPIPVCCWMTPVWGDVTIWMQYDKISMFWTNISYSDLVESEAITIAPIPRHENLSFEKLQHLSCLTLKETQRKPQQKYQPSSKLTPITLSYFLHTKQQKPIQNFSIFHNHNTNTKLIESPKKTQPTNQHQLPPPNPPNQPTPPAPPQELKVWGPNLENKHRSTSPSSQVSVLTTTQNRARPRGVEEWTVEAPRWWPQGGGVEISVAEGGRTLKVGNLPKFSVDWPKIFLDSNSSTNECMWLSLWSLCLLNSLWDCMQFIVCLYRWYAAIFRTVSW